MRNDISCIPVMQILWYAQKCQEYKKIHKILFEEYIKIFCSKDLDKNEYYFGIANFDIIINLSNYIYESYINDHLIKNTKKKQVFNFNSLHKASLEKVKFPRVNYAQLTKYKIKYLLDLLKYYFCYSKKYKIVYHIGSLQIETISYCKQNYLYPIKINLFRINKNKISNIFKNNLENKLDIFFNIVFNRYDFIQKDRSIYIKNQIKEIFFESAKRYTGYKKFIKNFSKDSIFLSTISGWLPIRNVIAAAKSNNFQIKCFNHGFSACFNMEPDFFTDGSLLSTQIVVSSKQYGKKYLKKFDQLKSNFFLPKIEFFKHSPYKKISKQIYKVKVNKIKKILLIGYPKSPLFNLQESHNHLFSTLELENNLIKILKKDFDVFYKAHPDRIREVEGIFDNDVNVIGGKFENIYKDYDCTIFTYYRSTALGYALMSSIPIVLLINSFYSFDEDTYKVLCKRCAILKTSSNYEDKLKFNKQELIKQIQISKKLKSDLTWSKFID